MKRILVAALLVGCMSALVTGGYADEAKKEMAMKSGKAMMSRYLVMVPHTAEQCMMAMDEVNAMGPQALAKWDFGCMDGDHTAYCIVSAANAEEALKKVPEAERTQAKAVKLHKFTAQELKEMHAKMKS